MNEIINNNKEWIDVTWEKVDKKLSRIAVKSRNKLPFTTINGVHDNKAETDIRWWTNGFFGGMMWLMYNATKNEEYRKTAERSEELLDEVLKNYDNLDHDVGFLWHLTSGANYRITGNVAARNKNLYLASVLAARYNIDAKFIRAWNGNNISCSIIDTLMNLAQLYWASNEVNDARFKRIAMSQMNMAMRDHIREDGSVNHIVEHDLDTGEFINAYGGQGYSSTSCWSRGLSWAVYGSVLSYIHAEKQEYLDAAIKTADYYIEHCKKTDYLPLIDFLAPKEPVYYDSTSGVIAACGMLEIAKFVPDGGKKYAEAAINILKAIEKNWCSYADDEDGLVMMGSDRYPLTEADLPAVHKNIIYGDFFFVEALLKLKGSDFLIW